MTPEEQKDQNSIIVYPDSEHRQGPLRALIKKPPPHRSRRRAHSLIPVIVLFVVVVLTLGCSIVFFGVKNYSMKPKTVAVATHSFPAPLLLFQNVEGSPATNATITGLLSSGAVGRQFSSSYADGAFDEYAGSIAPFSSGLLFSNQLGDGSDISVTKWTVMHSNGQISPVSSTLAGTLNNVWNNSGVIDGDLFLVGQDELYGLFENTSGYNLQQINLTTGEIQTVLQMQPFGTSTLNNNDIQLKGTDAAQSEMSFVMNNVSIGDRDISTPSVVVYKLGTGELSVTPLPPGLNSVAPAQVSQPPIQYALSADGTLLAYQESAKTKVNGVETTGFVTHVYNTQTGKDVATKTGPSINLGSCPISFTFSNDDRYLATCGATSVTENGVIEATNTSTGAVVDTLNGGNTTNYSIAAVGWIAVDNLAYVTNATSNGQPFNAAAETPFSLNLNTGGQQAFPTGLGEFLTIIY